MNNNIQTSHEDGNRRKKDFNDVCFQYKRALKTAFPKIRFNNLLWNWSKVYPNEDPYQNTRFLLIHNAFKNTLRRHGIPDWLV